MDNGGGVSGGHGEEYCFGKQREWGKKGKERLGFY